MIICRDNYTNKCRYHLTRTAVKFSPWNFLDVSEPINPADPVTMAILIRSSCELFPGIARGASRVQQESCPIPFVLFRSLAHDLIEKTVQGFATPAGPYVCCAASTALRSYHRPPITRSRVAAIVSGELSCM